ncbi:FadR/GntR family transcriptional regulator [Marinivivus vitaminiproducens]|uniref:FadR/GntR family transcriptional regulator n=1 Tax=Marinivivus vitaminiproducens TaxID=3035935 RepID=UPI0027AA3A07|nr:FadR/GntR family transcriptional regulator [Geminicoccaceae bacterium SCSIO 64248]
MPIEAVEPRRLYRQIADQLRQLIDAGEFAAGERLPSERDLADQLKISRPTVREALIALEVEGRVRIRVGSGIYVTEPDDEAGAHRPPAAPAEGPFELLRAREFVESAIAAEAALLARPSDILTIDRLLVRMEAGRHPSRTTLDLDRAFHIAVAEIVGNAVLTRLVGELFDQRINPYFEKLSSYFENQATWRLAFAEHRAVRDAIVAGDTDGARAAMRHHLRQSQIRFTPGFDEDPAAAEANGKERHFGHEPR